MDILRNKFAYFQEPAAEFATAGGETEDRHYEDEQVGDVNDEVQKKWLRTYFSIVI